MELKCCFCLPVQNSSKYDYSFVSIILIRHHNGERHFFLRLFLNFVVVAFLVALHQNKALLGNNGLLPTDKYLKLIKNHFGSKNLHTAFVNIPTLLLFTKDDDIDWWLDALAYTGLMFSGFVLLTGAANMLIMGSLWMLYHSIVNIGQRWWELHFHCFYMFISKYVCTCCLLVKLRKNSRFIISSERIPNTSLCCMPWCEIFSFLGTVLVSVRWTNFTLKWFLHFPCISVFLLKLTENCSILVTVS